MAKKVVVLGSFVADLAFRAERLPVWGETLMGNSFTLGPGGKGSNQAVAAARAGANVQFISKIGDDAFGALARETWASAGVDSSLVGRAEVPTGAAAILVDAARGENAIIVVPGACFTLSPAEIEAQAEAIGAAAVFLAQLELPIETVQRGLEIARAAGVTTVLNPAPAPSTPLPQDLFRLVDFLVPNESEAALLTGASPDALTAGDPAEAERTAAALRQCGAHHVLLTRGPRGSLLHSSDGKSTWVPPFDGGSVVDTTGAGDAFCGAFAAALAENNTPVAAARFASAAAGISVTRPGTAPSMPKRKEIEALLHAF